MIEHSSLEVQLGRMIGQQDMILRELGHAAEGRKAQYTAIEEVKGSVLLLNSRMETVEGSLTKFTPTIEEFISIKQKVVGAGKLGKFLWAAGAIILALAAKFHGEILSWLGK